MSVLLLTSPTFESKVFNPKIYITIKNKYKITKDYFDKIIRP